MAARLKLSRTPNLAELSKKIWDAKTFRREFRVFGRCMSSFFCSRSSLQEERKSFFSAAILSTDSQRLRCSVFSERQLFLGSMYSTASLAVDDCTLSPAVKYLVNTNSISDLSQIKPSGPKARILKGDVLQYLDDLKSGRISPPTPSSLQTTAGQTTPGRPEATVKSTPVPVVKFDSRSQLPSVGDKKMSYQDVPLDEVQRSRAEQMVQSKMTTPHIYATASCNVQRLVELSNALGESNGQSSSGLVAFIAKAAALTLERLPECNAVWSATDTAQPSSSVNVSITLSSDKGSHTSFLKDVNRTRVQDIIQTVKDVNQGAQVPQSQEGNFSIIYLGDSGVNDFTAILAPLQSAVLTVGSIKHQLADSQGISKSVAMTVTLSADARVYRDELVGRWLDEFKRTIESPDTCGLL